MIANDIFFPAKTMHIIEFHQGMLLHYLKSLCRKHLKTDFLCHFSYIPSPAIEEFLFFGLMLWITEVVLGQALFVFLLLPFLSNLKGIPFGSLLSYLKDGAGCFFNTGAKISG